MVRSVGEEEKALETPAVSSASKSEPGVEVGPPPGSGWLLPQGAAKGRPLCLVSTALNGLASGHTDSSQPRMGTERSPGGVL